MNDKCDGCKSAHIEIADLKIRLDSLENFKKWAEPILKSIQILVNDEKWKKIIAISFAGIVTYVYVYQIYPSFEKVEKAKVEVIKIVTDSQIQSLKSMDEFKTDVLKMLQSNEKKIIDHSTKVSDEGVKKVRTTLYNQKADLREELSKSPRLNINQSVGKQ